MKKRKSKFLPILSSFFLFLIFPTQALSIQPVDSKLIPAGREILNYFESIYGNQMIVNGIDLLDDSTAYPISDRWQVTGMPTTAQKTLDLGAGSQVSPTGVEVHTVWNTSRAPSDFMPKGSNDSSNWILLLQESGVEASFWPSSASKIVSLDGTQ